jgi:hypothetical protein
MAIAEQMRLWRPPEAEIISLSEELGVGQPVTPGPYADPAPPMAQLLAEHDLGWTVTNDFGRTINPWGPSGFSGAVDDRY